MTENIAAELSATGPRLCPVQATALAGLETALDAGCFAWVEGESGTGKTVVLRELARGHNGTFVSLEQWTRAIKGRHPLALEDSLDDLIRQAAADADLVIVDDYHAINNVLASCGNYPRSEVIGIELVALVEHFKSEGKRLVCGDDAHYFIKSHGYRFAIQPYTAADYAVVLENLLGNRFSQIDVDKVFRFAPGLTARQMANAIAWLDAKGDEISTEPLIDYLRAQGMRSNVNLAEVRSVSFADLVGVDKLIESLEANVILPLEDDELSKKYSLKPKRGVLLLGPPGTGKTTVGRALAHRLKSKFFLIDGTFIAESREFYDKIEEIFGLAAKNAPAVVFIDDCDAIFERGDNQGLYRYLLTKLDGLESESAGRVCVVLTAMNLEHLPPALIRSGRVELWLEMPLPDEAALVELLRRRLEGLPTPFDQIDLPALAFRCDGLVGADIVRLVEDGKLLFARHHARKLPERKIDEFFVNALDEFLEHRDRYNKESPLALKNGSGRPQMGFVTNGGRGSRLPY